MIDEPGTYEIAFSLYAEQTSGANRVEILASLVQIRESALVTGTTRTFSNYNRGSGGAIRAYVGGTARFVIEAGDSIELRISEAFTTAIVLTVGGTNSFIQVAHVLGAPSVDISGLGGVEAWIDPKAAYLVADVGKFLVENGAVKRVDTDYHSGHSKTIGGTASPGTWIDLGAGGDEGGGPGAHFRGWHSRANQVANPATGDFFCSSLYGDFESFHDITTGNSGWRAYNPFEADAYWDVITDSNGDDFSVASRGYYQADSVVHAFNEADEAGDAFTVHSVRRIIVSEAIVAASAESTEYKPRVYNPPGSIKSYVRFWGLGQTEAWPMSFAGASCPAYLPACI